MAKTGEQGADTPPIIIKKYANRRLYNTHTSIYVTLEDLAGMVRRGENFSVQDAKTGEDITRSVLAQIIFELEGKGQNLLPVSFLRQLIRFYGDSMQMLVPSFLDMSLKNFVQQNDRLGAQISESFGAPFEAFEGQIKQNMKLFEQAFSMFMPVGQKSEDKSAKEQPGEIENLRAQLRSMQEKLDRLLKQKT
jgi:polyhydroxyalkanoate synthesis repressor PhaR